MQKGVAADSDHSSSDSSDSELDYYGRQVISDNKNDEKIENQPSAAMASSQQQEQQPQETASDADTGTAELVLGTKYLGRVYHRSQVPHSAHEIRAAVRLMDERSANRHRDWWVANSGTNAAGTRFCAHCQIIGRRGMQSCRWGAGLQYACNMCAAAGRTCLHSAVVDGQMVIVAKDPQVPKRASTRLRS